MSSDRSLFRTADKVQPLFPYSCIVHRPDPAVEYYEAYKNIGRKYTPIKKYDLASEVIQSSINVLPAKGGTILLKADEYVLTNTLRISNGWTTLMGEGLGWLNFDEPVGMKGSGQAIISSTSAIELIHVERLPESPWAKLSGVMLKNLYLYGSAKENVKANIYAKLTDGLTIDHVTCQNAYWGIYLDNCDAPYLTSLSLLWNTNGLYLYGPSAGQRTDYAKVISSEISDNRAGYGIGLVYGVRNSVIGCNLIRNACGLQLELGSDNNRIAHNQICGFAPSTDTGVHLNNALYNAISHNQIVDCLYGIRELGGSDMSQIDWNIVVGITNPIVKIGSGTIVKYNKGYVTENSGTATFSGNGVQTSFVIAHGLAGTPKYKNAVKASNITQDIEYVTADGTNLTVVFETAPPSGTDNVVLSWEAEM